ncbi:DJ-1/PfpI family protein [Herbiconiux moechotypicola]|uniref:GlxA family transcriptional regulator n=1 Tax=Herbiconiux moechotypicola TaxID=637393 RepID=A0ABN3E6Z1_9MICO|nr:DJ-1/PfpI family protein [Herbiconiux moechotypicola]MCS5731985.1 DJ-1/PfpI family protein [Herbiconiux moechotypicola]
MRNRSHEERPRIGVLLFDGVKMLDFVGPAEVFLEAGQRSGGYEIVMISPDGREVTSSMGVRVGVQASAADAGRLDTLIVPGTEAPLSVFADARVVEAIRMLDGRSRRTAAICTGAFGVAAAGLLDGRRATTHWKFTDELAAAHPSITVEAEAIFTIDGRISTSAGVAAGIDLALALVEDDHGPEIARSVAQLLLVYMKRSGNQSQFSASLRGRPLRTSLVKRITEVIDADPARPHTAAALAAEVNVSVRHLTRVMRDELQTTPREYVTSMRLDLAVSYLDSGSSVTEAAQRAGFGSPIAFRRAFGSRFTLTPSEYQRRFQSTRRHSAR